MRADQAAIADQRMRADHAVRTQEHARSHGRVRVHHRAGMPLPPLREAASLLVEVLEQQRHAHRNVAHREHAGVGRRRERTVPHEG